MTEPNIPIRGQILATAHELTTNDREKTHGDPLESFQTIAQLWGAYVGVMSFTPKDVAVMMALVKVARTQYGTHNRDDYVDGAAYLAIACENHERTNK